MENWHTITANARFKMDQLEREAQRIMLENQLSAGKEKPVSLFCRTLDRLGKYLVEMGTVLRRRYGVSVQVN